MKYLKNVFTSFGSENVSINLTEDYITFTWFPTEIGNPNYDAFLEQAKLTDKQVKALKPDVWYDFPEGDK
jgi:hypothetical protein